MQVQKLSSELAEYKAESKAIKNQDLTIRKHEETIRELTAALEDKDQELVNTQQQAAAEADAALLSKMQVEEVIDAVLGCCFALFLNTPLLGASHDQFAHVTCSGHDVMDGSAELLSAA